MLLKLQELTSIQIGLILLAILLLSILLSEILDWSRATKLPDCLHYGYRNHNGPATWKDKFQDAKGRLQSPIHLSSQFACVVLNETQAALKFSSDYYVLPKCMEIYNDGHAVKLLGRWTIDDKKPMICSGPLKAIYVFHSLTFRWGPTDDNGSEHAVDLMRYAMEVQALHVKMDYKLTDMSKAVQENAIVIVSYFYQITPFGNPCFEVIANNLKYIRNPYSSYCIEPVPLSWIAPPFRKSYFSYCGSLTHPPCTEGVHWLIQTEPIGISAKQMDTFRTLLSVDGPMDTNARPVQEINCRDIFLYD